MIYTDKLPEDCCYCPCINDEFGVCKLMHDDIMDIIGRPTNCPLILIERWRLESCETCSDENCKHVLNCEGYNQKLTCEGWQPIENNQI